MSKMSRDQFFGMMKGRENYPTILVCAIGVLLAILHAYIRHIQPILCIGEGPATRPRWVAATLRVEFLVHLLLLGALITVTKRSIPAVSKPHYTSDGTESLLNSLPPEPPVLWMRIMTAWICAAFYVMAWSFAYGWF